MLTKMLRMPMTFYPEYAHTLAFLEQHGKDVNWSMNCPALIQKVGTKVSTRGQETQDPS